MKKHLNKRLLRKIILFGLDLILLVVSAYLALEIRFDFTMTTQHLMYRYILTENLPLYLAVMSLFIYGFGLYRSLWRYASINELISVAMAAFWSNVGFYVLNALLFTTLPRSFYVINMFLMMALLGGMRFAYRVLRRLQVEGISLKKNNKIHQDTRVLIIGAGEAGYMTSKEIIRGNGLKKTLVGFVDDDPHKLGRMVNGVKVLGNIASIEEIVDEYLVDEVIIAMPSITKKRRREIIEYCKPLNIKMKILPGVYELIDGQVNVKQIRDVNIEDLLGRDPVHLDNTKIKSYIAGKSVLVTGGGGSIGSELCRQVASFAPKELIIFDIYENNAYEIQNELIKRFEGLNLKVLIGSVRDLKRLEEVFESVKPDIVFHAAAHKHVPLMQDSPFEAIKNNTIGTYNVGLCSGKYGVERMTLISTDKAVNPTNIMGASKRLAELVIQLLNLRFEATEYMAVRFGNVLGSNGSVIPHFKKQIEAGGPVTVTHPEIIRYFMTIPEAVQLVLQAGTMAKGGEVFVLDMGEPVKIVTLAEDLIRLSGFEPHSDIEIKFTGLRPGEKLFEELLLEDEGINKTFHEKIYVGRPLEFAADVVEDSLQELRKALDQSDIMRLELEILKLIPTYRPIER